MKTETIENLGAVASKTSMAGAGATGVALFTSNEFLGLMGALVAVAGLLVTWYYKREANRRHAAEHELRMARLRQGLRETDLGSLGPDD